MKEKRLKKFLSSIRGHIDSGHSEVVEEKKNIDTSLEKILKLTSDKEKDPSSLGHSNETSELHPLIQDLHSQYQSLYGHYDRLIGKLKKKVHHNGESNGSFLANSSSSDSESSDSESNEPYNHNENAHRNEEEKISKEDYQSLMVQLESLNIRNAELETEAISMISRIKEGEILATKLVEREAAYLVVEDELNHMRRRNEVLQVENDDLKQELNQQQGLTSQSLQCLKEEKEALFLEKSMALSRLEQADKDVEEFKVKVEQLKNEMSQLQNENGRIKEGLKNLEDELSSTKESLKVLQVENGDLKRELEKSNQLQALINQKNEALLLEKSTVLKKLEEADGSLEGSKIEAEQLRSEMSKLQDENGVLKDEVEAKIQQVDDLNQKLASLNEEKDALSLENFTLLGKIRLADEISRDVRDKSDLNLKLANERLSENAKLLSENEKLKLELEVANQQVTDLLQKASTFEEDTSILKSEMLKITTNLQVAEKSIEELKSECEQLKDERSKLLVIHEDLNQQLKVKDDEKASLFFEYSEVLVKLKHSQENIEMLSKELERSKAENSQLQVKYEDIMLEFDGARCELSNIRGMLQVSQEEKSAIIAQNLVLLSNTQELEKMIDGQKSEKEHLECENCALKDKVDDLLHKLESVEEEKNTLASENLVTVSKLDQAESSLKETLNEVEQLKRENYLFQQDQIDSQHKISELGRSLEGKDADVSSLQKNLEEASSQIKAMTINEDNLQQELDLACIKINELEEQVKKMTDVASEKQILTENLEIKLRSEVLAQETMLKEQKDNLDELLANYRLLESQFQESQEEKSAITAQNLLLLSKTQELEKMIDGLKSEKEHLECENCALKDKIDDLLHKMESVEEEKNTLASENLVTVSKLDQAESSLKETLNEVEQLKRENYLFQQDQIDSQHRISELGRSLEGKDADVSSLQKNLEEASSQIKTMTINEDNLQQELDLACIKINELEEQVKKMTDVASEKQILTENLEIKLRSEVLAQETMLKEQKDNLDELLANYRLLESQFQESIKGLETAKGRIVQMESQMESKDETILLLQKVDEEQKLQISRLEENLKELSVKLKFSESERADLGKEITKLHGQVQTLEVQIRLSNQKLKITETENKEKEGSHKKTMEGLQEERRKLEEHISTLSCNLNLMKDELRQVKEVVEIEMESLGMSLNILELKLEGNCRQMQTQISCCSNDVVMIKQLMKAVIYAKEELENEKRESMKRLKYKDDMISMEKDKAGVLGSKLAIKLKEEERLVLEVTKLKKSMQELEKRVKEKDDELSSKDEEKREAIRQLCLLIEYHRENCNHLFQFLSATLKRSRRT